MTELPALAHAGNAAKLQQLRVALKMVGVNRLKVIAIGHDNFFGSAAEVYLGSFDAKSAELRSQLEGAVVVNFGAINHFQDEHCSPPGSFVQPSISPPSV